MADLEEESKEPAAITAKKATVNPVVDVTEENIGEFGIEDVVMPMIGNSVKMPKNAEVAAIITGLLE